MQILNNKGALIQASGADAANDPLFSVTQSDGTIGLWVNAAGDVCVVGGNSHLTGYSFICNGLSLHSLQIYVEGLLGLVDVGGDWQLAKVAATKTFLYSATLPLHLWAPRTYIGAGTSRSDVGIPTGAFELVADEGGHTVTIVRRYANGTTVKASAAIALS